MLTDYVRTCHLVVIENTFLTVTKFQFGIVWYHLWKSEDLHAFLHMEVTGWGIPSQLCGHIWDP